MDFYIANAIAWGFTAGVCIVFVWWVNTLRSTVMLYLGRLDAVADGMVKFDNDEPAKEYARRLLNMSADELEREIARGRLVNYWGKEIAKTIEGLRASIPFLGKG